VPKYVLYTKCPFRWGGSGPTEYMVYWAHQSTHPIRHFDRFSRFSTDHGRRGVTSSQTHTCIHIHNERGGTENAGLEKSGLENVGPNRRGGKDGTGKHRTKFLGAEKAGMVNAGTSCAWVAKCNCRNTACRNSACRNTACRNSADPRCIVGLVGIDNNVKHSGNFY